VPDHPLPLPQDLGGGLRLRSATPADADALAAFNGDVHADAPGQPDAAMASWTRDLLTRSHPTFRPDLFTIVEETGSGRIVSSLNLIPQTWTYRGIELGVGRIELVGTHPEFRRRGLVRRQMEVAHGWSQGLGHLLQGITGIPWYYRRFGYALALDLGGARVVPVTGLPAAPSGDPEPYLLRPATTDDIPLLLRADDHGRRRSLLSSVRDASWWRYEIAGRTGAIAEWNRLWIVELTAGAGEGAGEGAGTDAAVWASPAIGYVAVDSELRGGSLLVSACETAAGASWTTLAPSLLRALRATGDRYATAADRAARAGVAHSSPEILAPSPDGSAVAGVTDPAGAGLEDATCDRLVLRLGAEHPLYDALPSRMRDERSPYAWYVRVADLPALLRHVAPVLDANLARSAAAGYTGELRLWFFTSGLRLGFAAGRLVEAAAWPEGTPEEAGATFPPLTFLHLVFGHRTLADLEYAFADCHAANDEARAVLEALFPKRPSFVAPLG
jgi:hypothetical protein